MKIADKNRVVSEKETTRSSLKTTNLFNVLD